MARPVPAASGGPNAVTEHEDHLSSPVRSGQEAPPPTQGATFAWGLPSAGAAGPTSHTLFAAHQAAALDEPGLPPPPLPPSIQPDSAPASGSHLPPRLATPEGSTGGWHSNSGGASHQDSQAAAVAAQPDGTGAAQQPGLAQNPAFSAQLLFYQQQQLAAQQLQQQQDALQYQQAQFALSQPPPGAFSPPTSPPGHDFASLMQHHQAQQQQQPPPPQPAPQFLDPVTGQLVSYGAALQPTGLPSVPQVFGAQPTASMLSGSALGAVTLPAAVPQPSAELAAQSAAQQSAPPATVAEQLEAAHAQIAALQQMQLSAQQAAPTADLQPAVPHASAVPLGSYPMHLQQPQVHPAHGQHGPSSGESSAAGSPRVAPPLQRTLTPAQLSRISLIAQQTAEVQASEGTVSAGVSANNLSINNLRQAPQQASVQSRSFDPNVMAQAAAYTNQALGHAAHPHLRRHMGAGLPPLAYHGGPFVSQAAAAAPGPSHSPAGYNEQLSDLTTTYEAALLASLGGGPLTPAIQHQAATMAQQQLGQQIVAQQVAAQQMAAQHAAMHLPAGSAPPNPLSVASMSATIPGQTDVAAAAAAAAAAAGHMPMHSGGMPSNGSSISQMPVPAPAPSPPKPKAQKVKVIISAGGRFVKAKSGDGVEYQGGETRLMQILEDATYADVLECLDRVAGSNVMLSAGSASSAGSVPALKYQLPSTPNVYVDVVDDEDVSLMLEEWREAVNAGAKSLRLHMFVQWRTPGGQLRKPSDGGSGDLSMNANNSAGSAEGRTASGGPSYTAGGASGSSMGTPRNVAYAGLAERMEVIHPRDIQLVKFLGAGGYGEVYLGKWHGSEAAVKCLNPGLFFGGGEANNNAAVAELVKEADMLGSLRHPNVVWVYGMVLPPPPKASNEGEDSGDDDGDHEGGSIPGGPGTVRPPAIVTEFMSGGSLRSALSRKAEMVNGMLPRLMVALDAAKGMEYLHAKGIVHFDMKSANLLLGHRDRRVICKVADFGLSKQKQQTYVSGVSSSRGTLPWIAPEIIKSPDAVTEKVDVYSFGIVLWELWTGREPFEGLNYHALLHQMTSAGEAMRPPMPGTAEWDAQEGEAPPEPAPGFTALVERCWHERPSLRPSFDVIVRDLASMVMALRPPKRSRGQTGGLNSGATARTGSGSTAAAGSDDGGPAAVRPVGVRLSGARISGRGPLSGPPAGLAVRSPPGEQSQPPNASA